MNKETVVEVMQNVQKGANIVVCWTRPAKTLKHVTSIIEKQVRMVGRIGVEYDNLKIVIEKRQNGDLPLQNQGLKGMEYEIYPYLLKAVKSGKNYLRLYKSTCSLIKPKVQWLLNGTEVDKNAILNDLLASEKQDSTGDCFSVGVENITQLHHETAEVIQEVESVEEINQPS